MAHQINCCNVKIFTLHFVFNSLNFSPFSAHLKPNKSTCLIRHEKVKKKRIFKNSIDSRNNEKKFVRINQSNSKSTNWIAFKYIAVSWNFVSIFDMFSRHDFDGWRINTWPTFYNSQVPIISIIFVAIIIGFSSVIIL